MVTAVGLGLTLAFEPTETDAMRRPPRPASESLLSGLLVWRIVLVSTLFVAGAFGMFAWTLARGLSVEEARTIVVNTIVRSEEHTSELQLLMRISYSVFCLTKQ